MKRYFLEKLIDPRDGGILTLKDDFVGDGEEVLEGRLVAADGTLYPIQSGIPTFVESDDSDQSQTADSFGYKWNSWESVATGGAWQESRRWFIERFFGSESAMTEFFTNRKRILDCGCGSGYSSSIYLDPTFGGDIWVGADISTAVSLAREGLGSIPNTHFVRADMMRLPFPVGTFDTIVAEGTLHHTPSTRDALAAVVSHLEHDGVILFYVYRKKAVVREFTDDFIRERIASLPPDEAMVMMEPLTQLGRVLSELKIDVEIPAVPLLEIPAGTYDLQRLFYWNIAKIFWNDNMSFEENNHVNFDWFHPVFAHRQTSEEVQEWCRDLGLVIERLFEDEAGITVCARRSELPTIH